MDGLRMGFVTRIKDSDKSSNSGSLRCRVLLTFSVRIQLVIFVTFTRILPDPIDLESASAFLLPLSP